MNWEKVAKVIEETYGFVNWDERFFICPECDEPIYEEDYEHIKLDGTNIICPVCEELL